MRALTVGDVVISRAGRDRGRCFVVYSLADDQFVTVVDGGLRGIARPKRKRARHLRLTDHHIDVLGGDHEIRQALKDAGYDPHVRDYKGV